MLFLVLIISKAMIAQPTWSSGSVVLKDRQVLTGEIQFHSDVLLMKAEDQVIVYPAHRVSSFRFYDAMANINRYYLSLRHPGFAFPVLHFYEVVTWGAVCVVRRSNYPLLNNNGDEKEYTYFSWQENEMTSLRKFRSDIYPTLLQQYPLLLKEFVATQNLNPNRMGDAIRIIKYYNQQFHARISIVAL